MVRRQIGSRTEQPARGNPHGETARTPVAALRARLGCHRARAGSDPHQPVNGGPPGNSCPAARGHRVTADNGMGNRVWPIGTSQSRSSLGDLALGGTDLSVSLCGLGRPEIGPGPPAGLTRDPVEPRVAASRCRAGLKPAQSRGGGGHRVCRCGDAGHRASRSDEREDRSPECRRVCRAGPGG